MRVPFVFVLLLAVHSVVDAQRPLIPNIPRPLTPKLPDIRIPRPNIPPFPNAGDRLRIPLSNPGIRAGQSQQVEPEPIETGIRLPQGPITYPNGENLYVRSKEGKVSIARYHIGVGDTRMVVMPNGQLELFDKADTRPCDKSFVPVSMNELEKQLLEDPRLKGFKTIRSRRFLYVYNTSETFVRTTRTILETMYPAVRKYFQRSSIKVHEPEFPLVVLAFATEDQYQKYRRMPRGIVAYYDSMTNHVSVYERSRLSSNAPEIAQKNLISTVAHEGAHQVLHNIGVQQRMSKWPMWLSEGVAEFFAPTSVDRGAKWQGLGATNALRMHEIDSDWKRKKPTGNGQKLSELVAADKLSSLDYAYSWGLIHMLSKRHQKELFACVRACNELRPLDGMLSTSEPVPTAQEYFTTHFGDQFGDLESELIRHLTSLSYVDPIANQTHYIVVTGGRVYMTSSPEKVQQLRKQTILGNAQVKTFPNRQAAERAMAAMTR